MGSTQTWLRVVLWSGAVMLLLTAVMHGTFPSEIGPLPEGLRTPILALELARSTAELEHMFGPVGSQRAEWIALVDRGNTIDFAFILTYGAFMWAAARAFITHRARARLGTFIAVVAAVGDAVENAALLAITARLGGEYGGALRTLMVATWIKWFALAGWLALLAPSVHMRGVFGKAASWVTAVLLPITLLAAIVRGMLAEIMFLAITLGMLAIWIEALRSLRRPPAAGSVA